MVQNDSMLKFQQHDISSETVRYYTYPDGELTIIEPQTLYLKRDKLGDSHRIVTKSGLVYCPRKGWLGISWSVRKGEKPVSF